MNKYFLFLFLLIFSCTAENKGIVIISPLDDRDFNLFPPNPTSTNDENLDGNVLLHQHNNDLFTKRKWQGIPSVGIDRSRNLFVAWYSGGNGEELGNYVTVSTSRDGGETWKKNTLVIAPVDSVRFFDPTFINDKFGNLYLAWAKTSKKKKNVSWTTTWCMKVNYKGDSLIYSDPVRIAEGIMMNKPALLSDSTSMLFPIAYWLSNNPSIQKPFIYLGKYGLKKFDYFYKAGYIPVKLEVRNYDEHMVVETNPHNFLGMVRTKDGIYSSSSIDGINWSEATKFKDLGPTTSSRFYLGKLISGNLILVMNNSLTRANLTIFISADEGKSWKYSKVIENTISTSYPDVVQDKSTGKIFLVYDSDRFKKGKVFFVSFFEKAIVNPSNESGFNKLIIDELY